MGYGKSWLNSQTPAAEYPALLEDVPRPQWILAKAIGWYAFGLVILVSSIGSQPSFSYNWEPYTAWHLFEYWVEGVEPSNVLMVTDGLMTDSGHGPLVGLPVWLGFQLGGVGLAAMRLPVMLVAGLAVPLTWLVGRRLVGAPGAVLATGLLALSPVWLLYGRTATLVGISLVPALLTIYVLLRVLEGGRRWIVWLVTLQVLLVTGAYAYAPIRFLWPLSVGLIGLQLARGPNRKRWLVALVITMVALPLTLVGIARLTSPDLDRGAREEITGYYNARGEHILALNEHPKDYAYYLKAGQQGTAAVEGTPRELAWRLIRQNTGDLARLLLDYDTAPALTHYYNPKGQPVGRLYPRVLAPFLALGLVMCSWKACARWRREDLVLLAMTGGFTVPMLLTSRVHIGRLVFALPFLFMLVAVGSIAIIRLLRLIIDRAGGGVNLGPRSSIVLSIVLGLFLVAPMAQSLWEEEQLTVTSGRETRIVRMLEALAVSPQAVDGVALVTTDAVGAEIESIDVAGYRLTLESRYRFIDLDRENGVGTSQNEDSRIPLYYGGLLDRLKPGSIPYFCSNFYLVAPAVEERFLAAVQAQDISCSDSIQHARLPN